MRNFKKFVLLSVLGLFLGACGSGTASSSGKDGAAKSSSSESTSIKDVAIEPEYGQMYNEELDFGTHIHIVGEIGEISEVPEHTTFEMAALSKDETKSSLYNIENYTSNNSAFKFSKNDMVDIWGTYQGNDEEGTPIIRAFVIESNHIAKRVSETINEFLNTSASQDNENSISEYHTNIEGIALFDDKIYEEIASKQNLTMDEITSILESNVLLTETIIEVSKVDNETQISIDSTDPEWIEFTKGDAAGSVKSNKQIWANNIKKTCEELKFALRVKGFDIHIQITNPADGRIALRESNLKSINYDIVTMTSIYDDEYDAIATECNRLYGEEVGQFIYNNDDKTYEVELNNEMRDTVSRIRLSGNTELTQSFIDIFISLQDDIQDNLGSGYSLTALDYYYSEDEPIVLEILDGKIVTDNLIHGNY